MRVRPIELPNDVPAWLALRNRAVAGLRPVPRIWSAADFQAEMLAKPWWRADRCWIAETANSPRTPPILVGSATLADRAGEQGHVPVVHWLLVDPDWRCRGIGRLLMNCLERAAWDAGHREIQLETHAGWSAAVAFYQSMLYRLPLALPVLRLPDACMNPHFSQGSPRRHRGPSAANSRNPSTTVHSITSSLSHAEARRLQRPGVIR